MVKTCCTYCALNTAKLEHFVQCNMCSAVKCWRSVVRNAARCRNGIFHHRSVTCNTIWSISCPAQLDLFLQKGKFSPRPRWMGWQQMSTESTNPENDFNQAFATIYDHSNLCIKICHTESGEYVLHESMVTGEVFHRRVIVRFPTNQKWKSWLSQSLGRELAQCDRMDQEEHFLPPQEAHAQTHNSATGPIKGGRTPLAWNLSTLAICFTSGVFDVPFYGQCRPLDIIVHHI